MSVNFEAKAFVSDLSELSFPNAFNPYSDICALHDLEDADAVRRDNLERALGQAISLGVTSLWVARDLGYRGGRRTGLAMTDERYLQAHAAHLGLESFRKATSTRMSKEGTAGAIWRAVDKSQDRVFLWNVFPLHPHEASKPMGNRKHTASEAAAGMEFVLRLVRLLEPQHVIGIGQDADGLLRRAGISAVGVRHPSYGGAPEFRSQLASLYGWAS
jgi:hypothetical protein